MWLFPHSLLNGNKNETLASKSGITGRTTIHKPNTSNLFPLEISLFLFLGVSALVSRLHT